MNSTEEKLKLARTFLLVIALILIVGLVFFNL